MDFFTILFIGIGLSMDACAVSLAKGMSLNPKQIKKYALILAFAFGFFQWLMPTIGYFAGSRFANSIQAFDHWIAFILLSLIGGNMIREGIHQSKEENEEKLSSISFKDILLLAIATSIDALAVGVSFAFLKVNLFQATITIGCTTFILSFIFFS